MMMPRPASVLFSFATLLQGNDGAGDHYDDDDGIGRVRA